jgi:hypothetical protein
MRRESLIPFVPAVLAALTNAVIVCVITAHQPDLPARFIVYQVVMLLAALLAQFRASGCGSSVSCF